jgi:CheY-like chemotaxis protein
MLDQVLAPPQAMKRHGAPKIETPHYRIVVVDDNRDAADALAMVLTQLGHDVHQAYDGPSAVTLIFGHRPHIVFLDLSMPEVSGFDVVRRIRDAPELDGTSLVAVTGLGHPSDVQATLAAGFDGHIRKPAPVEVIVETLCRLPDRNRNSPIVSI